MGKTAHRYRDDDDDRRQKHTKSAKHSRNVPGQGMRVINSWSEEDYDDDLYDDSDYDSDVHYANTTQTQRK